MSKTERQRREKLGRRAEFLAGLYLRAKGYRILETRFKTKAGEIDLIARKKDLIIIVEVKARRDLMSARESISYTSQKRIERAAGLYLESRPEFHQYGLRYDALFLIGRRLVHEPAFW